MKIEKIIVDKFRHMNGIEVLFGKNLTVISGQNGTGKSTILGMVGHIFDYKDQERTKNNQKFKAKYGDIFRFCPFHDKKGIHEYKAILKDDNGDEITQEAKSRFVEGEGKSGRFRIDIGDRQVVGSGAIDFPVIYLGLKRLYPLSQEKEDSIKVKPPTLDPSEVRFYEKYAKEISILLDETLKPQDIKSPNKEFLAMETPVYSYMGNSAGQDSLGQILTAILSFRELKEKKGLSYNGGILLIDEVDATFYAGSQINLIKNLYQFSRDFDLQIIFTTHSLEILELLKEKTEWQTEINFFELKNRCVKNLSNPPLKYIRNNILVQTDQEDKIRKINVLCEDGVTEAWCKNLLGRTKLRKRIEIKSVPISAGILIELAKKKHPAFRQMLFVVDGDQKKGKSGPDRVIYLPGDKCPEGTLYDFFRNEVDDEDGFWNPDIGFIRQVCFKDFVDSHDYKTWLFQNKSFFGRSYCKAFSRWKKANPHEVETFVDNFKNILDKIY